MSYSGSKQAHSQTKTGGYHANETVPPRRRVEHHHWPSRLVPTHRRRVRHPELHDRRQPVHSRASACERRVQALPDRAVSATRHPRNGFRDRRTRRRAEVQEREGASGEGRRRLACEAGRQIRRDVRGEAHPDRRARGEEPDRRGRGDDRWTGEGHRRLHLNATSQEVRQGLLADTICSEPFSIVKFFFFKGAIPAVL